MISEANMDPTDIHLLDLPIEILLKILKELSNIDVLYSFIGVEGLDRLVQDQIFTNSLNFAYSSSSSDDDDDDNYSMNETVLNRFCNDILPRIQHNVECLHLKTTNMDRILRTGIYPNLTQLILIKSHENDFSSFCTNELLFRDNFKKQIADLTVTDRSCKEESTDQTTNIYIKFFDIFENLKSLSYMGSYFTRNPVLSFVDLPSNAFVSSNLIKLCVTVDSFSDCLRLLDGRLNQLSTLIVTIVNVKDSSSMEFNSNILQNLKCFSLTYTSLINHYDTQIVPLLRQMCNLEDLTLYIQINERNGLVDVIQIENHVLISLSKLRTFVFYICTHSYTNHAGIPLPNGDLRRTFSNKKFEQVGCGVSYINTSDIIYNVFSLPFEFKRIGFIGNIFTNTIFKNVTFLCVYDGISFQHEFFLRLARSFPLLECLFIINWKAQSKDSAKSEHNNNESIEVVQYPHLTSLEFDRVHIDYVEQTLNASKTRLPCLKELAIDYNQLKAVTNNFTRDETRLNCVNVEELDFHNFTNPDDSDYQLILAQSKDFHVYFPLLKH